MNAKRDKRYRRTHLYIAAVLAAASIAVLLSTISIYRNSLDAAEDSLRLQALGIAASLEPSLQDIRGKQAVFSEIISGASWEGIAYIALYDRNGLTLLHSNETLVGRRSGLPEIGLAVQQKRPVSGYVTLGTGEEVFIMNYPMRVRDSINVLRLALHPYQAQDIIRQARLQAGIVSLIVLFLWIFGYFLIRAVRKSDELSMLIAEKERLAAIGEMAAVLAHEIRNPLGSIKGFAQYLAEGKKGGTKELNVIINEAMRLERLTGELLMYARPSAPKATEFVLGDLINEVVTAARASEVVRQNAIVLTASTPEGLVVSTDKDMLRQILSNIIQNAMEASGEHGTVGLSSEQVGDTVSIMISDNGTGMDEETISRALDSFFTTKTRGTGLGLAIVSRLITALGGKMEIQSSVGHGTVINITLSDKLKV
jgi:two-component system, NtrC family, sensor histidine kinase HydH